MSKPEEYRRSAAGCVLLAEGTTDPASQLQLMELARGWFRLAWRADKNGQAASSNEASHPEPTPPLGLSGDGASAR
jgi:hypothetical protein